jgi:hypothetical protein
MAAMEELADALEDAARRHVLAAMPDDPSGELEEMRLADLLITYGTWRSRLIPVRPRKCHISAELSADAKAVEHRARLDAIVSKIEAGGDLTPHLSRAVAVAHQSGASAAKLTRRKDRDLLVADWGLHHLHLSEVIEPDGFVERGDDLLFAAFTPSDAYLIGIFPHGSWALKELLAVIVHNWLDAGLVLPLNFVLALVHEYTDEERLQLRGAGIAGPMVTIDGKVYASAAMGQTSAGTPSRATQRSNVIMHTFREWREKGAERLCAIAFVHQQSTGKPALGPWQIAVSDEWIGLHRDGRFYGMTSLS